MRQGQFAASIFFRENIAESDLELVHHRLQFVEGEMMFAPLNPEQGLMGKAGLFSELGIRQLSPRFSQVFRQLHIQALSHPKTVAKES